VAPHGSPDGTNVQSAKKEESDNNLTKSKTNEASQPEASGTISQIEISQKISNFLSVVFVPPLLTLFSFAVVAFRFAPENGEPWLMLLYTSLFTVVIPLLLYVILRKKGHISDRDARDRHERHLLYTISSVVIFFGYFVIPWGMHSQEIKFLYIIYLYNLIFLFCINLFWKISAHLMGAGGMVGTLVFSFGLWGWASLPVVLSLGWARYTLKCHTLAQMILGAAFGIANTLLLFYYLPFLQLT